MRRPEPLTEDQLYEAVLFVHLGLSWKKAAQQFNACPRLLRARAARRGWI